MDKLDFEKEKEAEELIDKLGHKEETLSELSELASTSAVIPLVIPEPNGVFGDKASDPKQTHAPDDSIDSVFVPVRSWFVTLMCMNIPIIGWIYLIILACSPSKGPRRDFAKAYLLYKLVFLLISLAILAVAVHYGLEVLDKVLAYMEML